jgi:uncharacterized damage-inducible protein DinB
MRKGSLMKFLALLLAGLPVALSAQTKPALLKHWETAKHFTLAVADTMPADLYNYKPSDPEMTFGQLMNHIAQADGNYCARATGVKNPLAPLQGDVAKDLATARLTQALDFCIAQLKSASDADLAKMSGPEGKQMSGAELFWGGFTHMAHHRGQAEVYLRSKGIKPPDYEF